MTTISNATGAASTSSDLTPPLGMSRSSTAPGRPRTVLRDVGRMPDGRIIREVTLDNGRGLGLRVLSLGGIVTALQAPDRDGVPGNVVLGLPSVADYLQHNTPYLGVIAGRYANRIAGARFELDGTTHDLSRNDGANCLHGGAQGFGACCWDLAPEPVGADGSVSASLQLVSEHGDGGFPGRLSVQVRYSLTPANAWRIDYEARTDRPTVVNLTQHAYFNLAGRASALDQELTLQAGQFLDTNAASIPTVMRRVDGTPFDFRRPRRIADAMASAHPALARSGGFDHCWVLDPQAAGRTGALREAARLVDPGSGRLMTVHTTEPAIQFYAGLFLDGSRVGADGQPLSRGAGICLETQAYPDAPNRPDFPSTVLRRGQVYSSTTVYRFGTQSNKAV